MAQDKEKDKEKDKKKVDPTTAAIALGWKLWIFFMFGFYFLGYSAILSIALGAIAASCGGSILRWWYDPEPPNFELPDQPKRRTLAAVTQERIAKKQAREKGQKKPSKRRQLQDLGKKLLGK
ncbi:hypothetical protein [Oxynema aestuarii]|jgi:hypothetical protein|uniref:Uncharacterized protein n=1 Tax=Oxynema aestuarii AP17 TaxID=2064643 RepID=A0A6H1TTH9_9CYAN|nr:hypothetical protein [Oxynema aestuarii]QIZ69892.1 hypothetical protein HCG48_04260 [Oxynema aestuarii AP17]RMH72059.1 MAG: hypothetical protein D6680_20150 [Cyanobacteria bacterium J007]